MEDMTNFVLVSAVAGTLLLLRAAQVMLTTLKFLPDWQLILLSSDGLQDKNLYASWRSKLRFEAAREQARLRRFWLRVSILILAAATLGFVSGPAVLAGSLMLSAALLLILVGIASIVGATGELDF